MADTPQADNGGETTNQEAPSNNGTNTSTQPASQPQSNASDPAEVERLRKDAEQARLRANQLENELKKKNEAEEAARQKALEEQNEYKSLYEQEKAKRESIEQQAEAQVAKIELEEKQSAVFKDFPEDVVELAKETGLTLNENSDEAVESLKTKLTKLSERVSANNQVGPNNRNTTLAPDSKEELMREHAKTQTINPGTSQAYDRLLGGLNWVQQAKAENGDK